MQRSFDFERTFNIHKGKCNETQDNLSTWTFYTLIILANYDDDTRVGNVGVLLYTIEQML